MMAAKPLMLKDYLELESISESFLWASVARIVSKSFSKKLRRGLWKKSGSPDFFDDGSGRPKPRSPTPTLRPQMEIFGDGDRRETKQELCAKVMDCPSEEEKEQLSPVSVMDFPYQDEDEDGEVEQPSTISPCFGQCTPNIERTKNQGLQEIRRLESLARLDALTLDHLFSCTDTLAESTVHVETKEDRWQRMACSLLRRLNVGGHGTDCGEKLLLDFFVEGLSCNEECGLRTRGGRAGDEELLRAAGGWVAGRRIKAEHDGTTEMGSGVWGQIAEEEMVVVEITRFLLTWLLADLVADLVAARDLVSWD